MVSDEGSVDEIQEKVIDMAPAKKTTKKKKSDGPRSRKYGCVTYNSEP